MANRLAIMVAMLFFLSAAAKADEITYTYTGPAPADLSGSFTTAAPLTPGTLAGGPEFINTGFTNVLTWNFTDGVDTWTPANSSFDGGAFVNPDGTFADWNFRILSGGQTVAFSQTALGSFYFEDKTPLGDTFNPYTQFPVEGSFTMGDHDGDDPMTTPEPGSLLLLGAGLAALGAAVLLQIHVRA